MAKPYFSRLGYLHGLESRHWLYRIIYSSKHASNIILNYELFRYLEYYGTVHSNWDFWEAEGKWRGEGEGEGWGVRSYPDLVSEHC